MGSRISTYSVITMASWASVWLRRPVAVLAWAGALLIAGVWSAFQVPLEWVPQVELPEVRISATWPGASPRQVERYVTAPIERAVQTVPGTASVESFSQESTASIILAVDEDTDLGVYVAQVNERLALLPGRKFHLRACRLLSRRRLRWRRPSLRFCGVSSLLKHDGKITLGCSHLFIFT